MATTPPHQIAPISAVTDCLELLLKGESTDRPEKIEKRKWVFHFTSHRIVRLEY
jgi:hypothetical protein